MRIGVLCSGGDSPGMNAAIRGLVLRAETVPGLELLGFRDGWRGFHEHEMVVLDRLAVRGTSPDGGTWLGTSRVQPFAGRPGESIDLRAFTRTAARHGIDGFVLLGGDGTLTVAAMLAEAGVRVVGVPCTIDNDLVGTDFSIGFDSAVATATEAIDRLRTTGAAMGRCMVLEVMGREAGWIALAAGIAGGAHAMLLPEHPESLTQVCDWVRHVRDRDRSSLIVVAEGFAGEGISQVAHGADELGRPHLGGVAEALAPLIEARTGIETRATVLGYVQRGGTPTAFDRVLATRLGMAAADAVASDSWGVMVAMRSDETTLVPLGLRRPRTRLVPASRYAAVRRTFG